MKREEFNLTDITLQSGGGCEIKAIAKTETPTGVETDEIHRKLNRVVHPDMRDPFKTGVEVLFKVLGFDKMPKGKHEEQMEKLSCHSVKVRGTEEHPHVIITGKLETNGTRIAINSPKVKVDGNGYNVDLSVMVDTLADEAYRYLYEGKKAQTEIGDE